jgi:hypothetical protein
MTRADRIVIAAIAVVALVAWPFVASAGAGAGRSVSIAAPGGVTTRSLDADDVLTIAGSHGEIAVRISGGTVTVTEADCPDQTCVRTGEISSAGSVIACVPNGVVIRVGGGDGDDLDARVR